MNVYLLIYEDVDINIHMYNYIKKLNGRTRRFKFLVSRLMRSSDNLEDDHIKVTT